MKLSRLRLFLLVTSLWCTTARAAAPVEPVLETDFSKLEPFSTGYSAGGGPEKAAALGAWGTNLWKAGSQAESGVAEEPRTRMRGFYMTNREGTPSIQLFTLKPAELKPGQNYLASFVYMTDDGASGSFSVRPEGQGEPTREDLAGIGIWKERVVPFTAPPSGQVSFLFQTGSVNARLWLREFRLREGPRQWKPSPNELPAPGARLDEARVKRVLHVIPSRKAARDSNAGTAAAPLKSFGGALEAAHKYLRAGQGVKILLAPGFYREGGLHFDGEKVGGQAVDAPLIIEGAPGGQAVFSGADASGWEAGTWTLVDAQKRIYKHAWPHNWGPSDASYYKPDKTLAQRREILLLNGRPLKQAMVENIAYKPGGWEPRVDDEGMRGKGNWSNEGYLGPGVLKPGEFGVRELGPNERIQNYGFDGGADANTIFLRLPEGMASLEKARIEIGVRPKFLRVLNKNNLAWRNIAVEGFASYWGGTALEVEWFWSGRDNHDWLFERCDFRFNGGVGLRMDWVRAATLRRCTFRGNGDHGMSSISRDSLFEDCDFSNNGTRHQGHGLWFAMQNALFRRCSADGNAGFGFRNDHSGHYLTFEDCRFNNNTRQGGIFFEIAQGPITMRRCEVARNKESGMRIISVNNVSLDSCRFIENEGAQVFIEADKRNTHLLFLQAGTNVPLEYPYMKNWKVENCLFVARGEGSSIWSKIWWGGSPPAYVDWFKNEFSGRGNRYWSPDTPRPFNVSSAWDRKDWVWTDLAGWKAATGSDENSVWGPPQQ